MKYVEGDDWDATVTRIVSNPISVREAFWVPYKKLVKIVEDNVTKRAQAADATRARILEAAQASLERGPVGALRVEEVARDAGVARSTIYLLFESRAGLFEAGVVLRRDESQLRHLLAAQTRRTPARACRQPHVGGGDALAAAAQEVRQFSSVHVSSVRDAGRAARYRRCLAGPRGRSQARRHEQRT